MEDRAEEPASRRMFEVLIADELASCVVEAEKRTRFLEVGCGCAWLSRRIRSAYPESRLLAVDKSEEMVRAARALALAEGLEISVERWDACRLEGLPGGPSTFDWIVSSALVPHLAAVEVEQLVGFLMQRLEPKGWLVFLEQEPGSESLLTDDPELAERLFASGERAIPSHAGPGMEQLLAQTGLELLPRLSFTWTDDAYGPYLRELISRIAADALASRRISQLEWGSLRAELEDRAASGGFSYSVVYHRIASRYPTG